MVRGLGHDASLNLCVVSRQALMRQMLERAVRHGQGRVVYPILRSFTFYLPFTFTFYPGPSVSGKVTFAQFVTGCYPLPYPINLFNASIVLMIDLKLF